MKICPICGFANQDNAQKCTMCDSDFSPASYVTQKNPENKPPEVLGQMFGTFFLALILVLPFSLFWADPLDSLSVLIPVFIGVYLVLASIIVQRSNTKEAKERAEKSEAEKAAMEANASDAQKEDRSDAQNSLTNDAQSQNSETKIALRSTASTPIEAAALLAATDNEGAARAAHMLLCALASKKLIFLCADKEAGTENIKKALLRLTSKEVVSLLPEDNTSTDSFTQQYLHHFGNHYTTDTSRIDSTLINVEQFKKLIEDLPALPLYLQSPYEAESIFVDSEKIYNATVYSNYSLTLPACGKLFVFVKPADLATIPADIAALAAWLPLGREADFWGKDIPDSQPISFGALVQMTENAEKQFYLSEERWKKVDEFSEFLEEKLNFCFDNRKTNAFERFIGVYMAIGHSEVEALDAALAALILPECFASMIGEDGFDAALRDRLDAAFSLENLPLCTKALEYCVFAQK